MTGLQKIIDGILEEADIEAANLLKAADAQAAHIMDEAKREAEQYLNEQKEAAKTDEEKFRKQAEGATQAKERTVLLTEKQAVLTGALHKAYEALCQMPVNEYTAYLEALIESHLRPGDCTMYLSAKDRERLPQAFFDGVTDNAAKKGCRLTISEEPKAMDGGCLLSFGGIEENCSFEALFAANQNRLLDRANTLLFG